MSWPFTHDVTATVAAHTWKWQARDNPINAILWHETRGRGDRSEVAEYGAFINWVTSPENLLPGGYAGIANCGIGPGVAVLVVPPHRVPRYSSWPSDAHAFSCEVARCAAAYFANRAYSEATIEKCVEVGEWARAEYGIAADRVYPTNDAWWGGEAGHADTVQGRAQGKTDPAPIFWTQYLAMRDGAMTPAELARMNAIEVEVGRLRRVLAEHGVKDASGIPIDPGVELARLDAAGINAMLSIANLNAALRELRATVESLTGGVSGVLDPEDADAVAAKLREIADLLED